MIVSGLWSRINYLVPEPDCRTKGNEYSTIIWADSRPMPTMSQIQAITDNDLSVGKEDRDVNRKVLSKINRLLFNELIALDDRMRALEGQPPIVRLNYMNQLKVKFMDL